MNERKSEIDGLFERNPPPWRSLHEDGDDPHTFTVRDANGGLVCRMVLNEEANNGDGRPNSRPLMMRIMEMIWFYCYVDDAKGRGLHA